MEGWDRGWSVAIWSYSLTLQGALWWSLGFSGWVLLCLCEDMMPLVNGREESMLFPSIYWMVTRMSIFLTSFKCTSCKKATVSICKLWEKLTVYSCALLLFTTQGWAGAFANSGKSEKGHSSLHRQHQAGQLWGAALWELCPWVQLGAVVHVHQPPQGLVGCRRPLAAHQVCRRAWGLLALRQRAAKYRKIRWGSQLREVGYSIITWASSERL